MSLFNIIPTACYCHNTVHRWDFLEEKNNKQLVFFKFITPQQSKPLNNKKLHSNKCFGMYSYK